MHSEALEKVFLTMYLNNVVEHLYIIHVLYILCQINLPKLCVATGLDRGYQ